MNAIAVPRKACKMLKIKGQQDIFFTLTKATHMKQKLDTCLLPITVIALVLLLNGCNNPQGNATQGKRWYTMHNCSSCHGANGQDGRAAEIAAIDMSFHSFVDILRDPYSPSMPRFPENKLSKEDAADIYAWLKSIPR